METMDPETATPEIIRKILATGTYSAEDLDHLYRYLSKKTHPDLTGSDGEAFIRLREIYLKARNQTEEPVRAEILDPLKPVREAGFPGSLTPRENLYVVLKRFFQAGFHNRKLRDSPAALHRAGEIIRSLQYWCSIYSPPLNAVIGSYLEQSVSFMKTSKQFKDYAFGRRLFLQGTDLFFRYQASGRNTTRDLAEEKLSLAAIILTKIGGEDHPTALFSRWFLTELEKAPVFLEGL